MSKKQPDAIQSAAGQIAALVTTLLRLRDKHGVTPEEFHMLFTEAGEPHLEKMILELKKPVTNQASGDMIVRRVPVDRNRMPQEALEATGRKLYVSPEVVATMPRGESDEADVYFFQTGWSISDPDLEKEYERRGLKPADPYTLAAVNEADPAFADQHPNGTHWKDADDKWCYAAFLRWDDGRHVYVRRGDSDWNDRWWFAGLRK